MSSPVVNPEALLPYIVGAILGIITLVASGFLKEFFDERSRIATHKREVARHVLKICIEASTGNYQQEPSDMKSIYSTLTDLEGIDKDMEKNLNNFVNLWNIIRNIKNNKPPTHDQEKYYFETNKEIEDKREILVAWANGIRTGNEA